MPPKNGKDGASILAWPGLQPGTRDGHGSHEPEDATPTTLTDSPPEPTVRLTKTTLQAIVGEIRNLRQRQRGDRLGARDVREPPAAVQRLHQHAGPDGRGGGPDAQRAGSPGLQRDAPRRRRVRQGHPRRRGRGQAGPVGGEEDPMERNRLGLIVAHVRRPARIIDGVPHVYVADAVRAAVASNGLRAVVQHGRRLRGRRRRRGSRCATSASGACGRESEGPWSGPKRQPEPDHRPGNPSTRFRRRPAPRPWQGDGAGPGRGVTDACKRNQRSSSASTVRSRVRRAVARPARIAQNPGTRPDGHPVRARGRGPGEVGPPHAHPRAGPSPASAPDSDAAHRAAGTEPVTLRP